MKRLIPLALLLLCWFAPLQADAIRIIDLQHRSAEEIIPLLRPMLEPGVGLSGSGYTLIVRAGEDDLAQLDYLLERLDQARRQLLITVRQGRDLQRSERGLHIEGEIERPRTRVYSTRRRADDGHSQQLRISEGEWAMIRSGQAVPQVIQREQHGPGGLSRERSIEYRDVDSGFEVRPMVSGEQVSLDIRPHSARMAPGGAGVIEQQSVVTRVSGRLGEWIELAGAEQAERRDERGTVYSTRQRQRTVQDVWVKVEELE